MDPPAEEADPLSRKEQRRLKKRSKRRKRALRITVVVLSLLVVLAAGAVGYGYFLYSKIHRIHVRGLTVAAQTGADAGTENILMVGSTDRCALTVQYPAYGLCSQGVNGVNSDVVMILHLNSANHSAVHPLHPPGSLRPQCPDGGPNKIDAALYEGPSQLVAAIQEDFGIPIQDYVELNFDTFANVVNALGGINMYFPEPVYDAYSGLDQQTPGASISTGYHALQVVRARHLQYKGPGVTSTTRTYWPQEAQSDLARIRRDHEFLRVLARRSPRRARRTPSPTTVGRRGGPAAHGQTRAVDHPTWSTWS